MDFVLDASITLGWCFADEATTFSVSLLESLTSASAYVPQLWSLEVGNILIGAVRRNCISYAKVTEFLSLLNNLNIRVDQKTADYGFHDILALAYAEKLTTYDAAYLELAMRLGKPLATKDEALAIAAQRLGVKVLAE